MDNALTRRGLVASALALAACEGPARGQTPPPVALKTAANFPVGASVTTSQLAEPGFAALFLRQFDQLTPEWEMKMERVLKADGSFDFGPADAIAAFARANRVRLHGHTLIWYAQDEAPAFRRIDRAGAPFENAYRNYILAVAGRYRGQAVGWDVVNEAVAEDGEGYRDCLWRANLGMDYVAKAFRYAREAEPQALLFLNDYNLETLPKKRAGFLRLAEQLLHAGAPLGGLGCQTHLSIDVRAGAVKTALADLARLGLPIHVSELDISTRIGGVLLSPAQRLQRQARLAGEVGEAFAALPARQRYAVTTWGVRDKDSWLTRPPRAGDGSDRPLLFDDAGAPKPAARAFVASLRGGS
jgi:endo-1,4-beta-xylanase